MAGVPVVLITANVGSIFEEPKDMLKIWTEEFLSTITRLDPKFIALHCQEVGGKNYEQSMRHVEDFVRLLMSSEELRLFDKVRVYLDEDFSSPEHFTALGNFYFVHDSLKDVLLWDFKACKFMAVNGKEVHSGNIEAVTTKEKAKFPQDFFPECKWSRKGFLRTRWSISGTTFDLINIHLFHDASNFIAMETFPSVYSKTRRRALEHTLERIHNDHYPNAPYFVFGDFNFRTDTAGVIKKLTEDTQENKTSTKGSVSKLQFRNNDDVVVLTLGKKEFSHHKHQNVFIENGGQWLKEFDKELDEFKGRLFEFPVKFIPSYPFEEDIQEGTNYMQTRVPGWCDRILLNSTARSLIQNIQSGEVEYGIIGAEKCMGDHKPVYLKVNLALDAGIINCCNIPDTDKFCFRVPKDYLDLESMPDTCSFANTPATNRSSNFLHAIPVKHDPYTPDSMESPSPNKMVAAGYTPFLDTESSEKSVDSEQRLNTEKTVSPALLKSKLEMIANNERHESDRQEKESEQKDLKRSPSAHHLLEVDNEHTGLQRNRSNSDVSWKKTKLFQSETDSDHGFHSIDNFFSQNKTDKETAENFGHCVVNREIPQIKIINASNMVSNESFYTDIAAGSSETRTKSNSIEMCEENKVDVDDVHLIMCEENKVDIDDVHLIMIDELKLNGNSKNVESKVKLKVVKVDIAIQTDKVEEKKTNNSETDNLLASSSEQPEQTTRKVRRKKKRSMRDPNVIMEYPDTALLTLDCTDNSERIKTKRRNRRVNGDDRNGTGDRKLCRKTCCVIS